MTSLPSSRRRILPTHPLRAAVLGLWASLWAACAQPLIEDIRIDFRGEVSVRVGTLPDRYYVLLAGEDVTRIDQPVDVRLGTGQPARMQARRLPNPDASFFQVQEVLRADPLDLDQDGIDDVWELEHPEILKPLEGTDAGLDPDGNGRSSRFEYEAARRPLTTVLASSPAESETGVSPYRETVIRFTAPLAPSTVIPADTLVAEAAGRRLLSRVELAGDLRTVTLFPLEPLPGSARVRVTFDGSGLSDHWGRLLDADGDGVSGGTRQIEFETLGMTPSADAVVYGRVFASELAPNSSPGGTRSINTPLAGVIVTADGLEEAVRAVTDSLGNFRLTNAPAGEFFVHIDGRPVANLSQGVRYPDQAYYPFVGKRWKAIAGREVHIGDIYLPLVTAGTLQPVSATEDTVIQFPESVVAGHPELAGVTLTVPANALFNENGVRGGRVGIAPVPADRLPEPLPDGLSAPLVITVQTDGPANFDQPVPVCFPNLADPGTGQALPPGAKTGLWSFNHDIGRWEVVGPMTISPDGRFACSDPGYGIRQPGWHFPNPGTSGDGGEDGPEIDVKPPPHDKKAAPSTVPGGGLTCGNPVPNPTDPIRFHSGEFYHTETDLRIRGVGMDFEWTRHYRSRMGVHEEVDSGPLMGFRWDYSYNIFLLQSGSNLLLHDGNHRNDLLFRVRNTWADPDHVPTPGSAPRYGDWVWVQNGQPYEMFQREDGSFRLVFPDKGYWEFGVMHEHPFVAPGVVPHRAVLQRIVDRNGNTMRLEYDEWDRLVTVWDTLDRRITVNWGIRSGRLESITDFTGRTVRYEYFGQGEIGGWVGQLKAVVTPPILDTPTGNDFPDGKRTSYTYSYRGHGHPLSHNLTSITDGRRNDPSDGTFGTGPWLRNEYGEQPNEENLYRTVGLKLWGDGNGIRRIIHDYLRMPYDRVVRQHWGHGTIEVDYEAFLVSRDDARQGVLTFESRGTPKVIPPSIAGQAIPGYGLRTVVRDRVGNVSEYFYDAFGTTRRFLQYTGRSRTDTRVTRLTNRPTGKLRATDPEFFATEYGDDAQANPNLVRHPNGNEELSVYDQAPRANRNLRSRTRQPFLREGLPYGSQPSQTEFFEYDTDHAGCCGFQFVTRATDARGNSVVNEYDDRGNLTNRIHQIQTVTESWEYNPRGQVTRHVLPDNGTGHRRVDVYEYYEEGPARGYLAREIVDAGGLNLTTEYEYDAVGNLTRKVDPAGHDTLYVYNALDQVVREFSPEVKPGVRIVRDTHYDANNNIIRTDVDNLDEQGEARANAQLTTTYEYNLLNSLVRKSEEIDEGRFAVTEYDYDANENLVEIRYPECVAGRQPSNRVRYEYDERGLLFRQIQAPGSPEESVTEYDYDGNKNLVRKTEAVGTGAARVTVQEFDGYDRVVRRTDAMGNVTHFDYDANGNLTSTRIEGELVDVPGATNNVRLSEEHHTYDAMNRRIRTEVALFEAGTQTPVSGGSAVTEFAYNGLSQLTRVVNPNGNAFEIRYDRANRREALTDAKGNTVAFDYDLRGLVIGMVETDQADLGGPAEVFATRFGYDALGREVSRTNNVGTVEVAVYDSRGNRVVQTDGRGNVVRSAYDGLDRLLATVRELTDSGDGSGSVIGTLTTRQEWDDSGRLRAQIDDNGNATRYLVDGLGRRYGTVLADGTGQTNRLNALGNPEVFEDANGSRVVSQFDALGRLIRKEVTPGPGVSDDTTFEEYRYDGRSRLIRGEDDDSVVELAYDSAGRVLRDVQNGRVVGATYDAGGNTVSILYPSGRVVRQTFDSLERLQTVSDEDGEIASYAYVGPSRVARRDTRNGVRMAYQYDGVTGVPNPVGDFGVKRIIATTHTRVADGTVLDNRAYAWDRAGNKTALTERHEGGERRVFAYDSVNRLVQSARTPASGETEIIQYRLDGVGNRVEVLGGPDAGIYTMSAEGPEPSDRAVNQYTTTPFDSRTYDRNGNLVKTRALSGGAKTLNYDYRDRVVGYVDEPGQLVGRLGYDVMGRRMLDVSEVGEQRRYYTGWRYLESESNAESLRMRFVRGLDDDECIRIQWANRDISNLIDAQFSTVSILGISAEGTVPLRFADYGSLAVPLDLAAGLGILSGMPLYHGLSGSGLNDIYDARTRLFASRVGRFIGRDKAGGWWEKLNVGNYYSFPGNSPYTHRDPFGLQADGRQHLPPFDPNRDGFPEPMVPPDGRLGALGEIVKVAAGKWVEQRAKDPRMAERIKPAVDGVIDAAIALLSERPHEAVFHFGWAVGSLINAVGEDWIFDNVTTRIFGDPSEVAEPPTPTAPRSSPVRHRQPVPQRTSSPSTKNTCAPDDGRPFWLPTPEEPRPVAPDPEEQGPVRLPKA